MKLTHSKIKIIVGLGLIFYLSLLVIHFCYKDDDQRDRDKLIARTAHSATVFLNERVSNSHTIRSIEDDRLPNSSVPDLDDMTPSGILDDKVEVAVSEPMVTKMSRFSRYEREPAVEAAIEKANQDFAMAIYQSPLKNPYDPAYLELWEKEARKSDNKLRAVLGWREFQVVTKEAVRSEVRGSTFQKAGARTE